MDAEVRAALKKDKNKGIARTRAGGQSPFERLSRGIHAIRHARSCGQDDIRSGKESKNSQSTGCP